MVIWANGAGRSATPFSKINIYTGLTNLDAAACSSRRIGQASAPPSMAPLAPTIIYECQGSRMSTSLAFLDPTLSYSVDDVGSLRHSSSKSAPRAPLALAAIGLFAEQSGEGERRRLSMANGTDTWNVRLDKEFDSKDTSTRQTIGGKCRKKSQPPMTCRARCFKGSQRDNGGRADQAALTPR